MSPPGGGGGGGGGGGFLGGLVWGVWGGGGVVGWFRPSCVFFGGGRAGFSFSPGRAPFLVGGGRGRRGRGPGGPPPAHSPVFFVIRAPGPGFSAPAGGEVGVFLYHDDTLVRLFAIGQGGGGVWCVSGGAHRRAQAGLSGPAGRHSVPVLRTAAPAAHERRDLRVRRQRDFRRASTTRCSGCARRACSATA